MFTVKAYRGSSVSIDEAKRVHVSRGGNWAEVMVIYGPGDFTILCLGEIQHPQPDQAIQPPYDEVIVENSFGKTTEIVRVQGNPANGVAAVEQGAA